MNNSKKSHQQKNLGDLLSMITITDLNISQESCLTELKDAEMMGHIMGGFLFRPQPPSPFELFLSEILGSFINGTFPTNGIQFPVGPFTVTITA